MRRTLVLGLVALFVAACAGAPILANPPADRPAPASPASRPSSPADPFPIALPADDAPHDRLTEWWYYTGHLQDAEGAWYGFEYVIFRAERGAFPVAWASHLAVTDEVGQRFAYAQRSEVGPQVDRSEADDFAFAISGADPTRPETFDAPPWTMAGSGGHDTLAAADPATGIGLALDLETTKPAALHDTDGWIDFGPAGGSYYYSRTSMTASGSVTVGGMSREVQGIAWFDHQWGDFIAVGGGGWDWFAINLDDGTELSLSLVRDRDGSYPLVYGTLVAQGGATTHLPAGSFTVEATGAWTSPRTGAIYPSGWRVRVPGEQLDLTLTPVLQDQELDTRTTTGVIYWEGAQTVAAIRDGRTFVSGRGYVELTGYAPGG